MGECLAIDAHDLQVDLRWPDLAQKAKMHKNVGLGHGEVGLLRVRSGQAEVQHDQACLIHGEPAVGLDLGRRDRALAAHWIERGIKDRSGLGRCAMVLSAR